VLDWYLLQFCRIEEPPIFSIFTTKMGHKLCTAEQPHTDDWTGCPERPERRQKEPAEDPIEGHATMTDSTPVFPKLEVRFNFLPYGDIFPKKMYYRDYFDYFVTCKIGEDGNYHYTIWDKHPPVKIQGHATYNSRFRGDLLETPREIGTVIRRADLTVMDADVYIKPKSGFQRRESLTPGEPLPIIETVETVV